MKKRPLQDIVTRTSPRRRVVRHSDTRPADVRSPEHMPPPREPEQTFSESARPLQPPHQPVKRPLFERRMPPMRRSERSWLVTASVVGAVLLVSALLLATIFSGAKVTVYPRMAAQPIDGAFVIAAEDVPGYLSYDFMTLEETASRTVEATETREVEERAFGNIIIYNDFDESVQRLIKNTRFESKEGKIYRIRDGVDVPGKSGEVPGQIEVTVYADEPGEAYNVGLTEFTIPGFQGTARFDGFYANSVTPIAGGFVGEKRTIDEEELSSIRADLQRELSEKLAEEALVPSRKPEGVYLYPDAILYEFTELPSVHADENGVEIREKGAARVALFDQEEFAEYLASQVIAGYDGAPIALLNPEDLTVTITPLAEEAQGELPWEGEGLNLRVTGEAKFAWTFNEDQLKADLAGRHEDARHTILRGYPAIGRAEIAIQPFWKNAFPEDVENIEVERVLED